MDSKTSPTASQELRTPLSIPLNGFELKKRGFKWDPVNRVLSIPLNGFASEEVRRAIESFGAFNSIEWILLFLVVMFMVIGVGFLSIPLNGFAFDGNVWYTAQRYLFQFH